MRLFDAAATRDALSFERLIPALRAMFAAGCVVPPRHLHEPGAAGTTIASLIMPAWTDRHYGVKIVNVAPGNAARGLPGLHASYLLHDAATGVPMALIDGDVLTARRTAATSALAASWLARPDATHLVVVGAGRVASLVPEAMACVRPIRRVTVWTRSPAGSQALASRLRERGVDAGATGDLEAAVRGADIVSCATLATEPLVKGRWLAPGSHLDLVGSFTPAMREADDDCLDGAAVYVDTDEALVKSGDLAGPIARGAWRAADLRGTLASLATGQSTGRVGADARTVFKSVGSALEDLAAALLVAADARG
ncbi:MAG: ornithine cyclodeaminase family protein [Lautropia sp.]